MFKGKTKAFKEGQTTDYAMDIELFDKVLPEKVKKSLTGKSLYFTVPKKGEYAHCDSRWLLLADVSASHVLQSSSRNTGLV